MKSLLFLACVLILTKASEVVLITGASSGIGAASALYFARKGLKVALTARRINKLEDLVQQIKSEGGEAIAIKVDVTNEDEVDNAFAVALESFGAPVSYTFANAGFAGPLAGSFVEIDFGVSQKIWDVNVRGTLLTIRAATRQARLQNLTDAAIVVSSSVAGLASYSKLALYPNSPMVMSYPASKLALMSIVRSCASLGSEFRVYGMLPCVYSSEMVDQLTTDIGITEDAFAGDNPIFPGVPGNPADLAKGAYAMFTNSTGWPSGSNVLFDGDASFDSRVGFDTIETTGLIAPDLATEVKNLQGTAPRFTADEIAAREAKKQAEAAAAKEEL